MPNVGLLHRYDHPYAAYNDMRISMSTCPHHAFYNSDQGRIEMRLVSKDMQQVRVGKNYFVFSQGENIHAENSYKYAIDEFQGTGATGRIHASGGMDG